jgi:uncharacterized membrane protein YqaE (UPF0057 family)
VHRNGYHVEWWGSKQKFETTAVNQGLANGEQHVADKSVSVDSSTEGKEEVVLADTQTGVDPIKAMNQTKLPKRNFTAKKLNTNTHVTERVKESLNTPSYQARGAFPVSEEHNHSPSLGVIVLVSILLAPLGMYLYEDDFTDRVLISLILWCFGFLPGIIYTLIIILGGY